MTTKLDARQTISRDVLDQLAPAANTELDNLLRSINNNDTPPLRMTVTGSSRVVTIGSIFVQNPETNKYRTIPTISNLLPNFTSATITAPSVLTGGTGTITVSAGTGISITMAVSQYIKIGVNIDGTGALALTKGVAASTLAAATAPAGINGTFAIGYFVLNTDATPTNPLVGVIQNLDLYQYVGGGGGGGSGDTTSFIETLKNQLNDSVYEFVTPNIISTDGATKVDATPTTATLSLVNNTYQFTKTAGTDWTTRSKTGVVQLTAVTWSPELGLFCAVGDTASASNIFTSPDGITWTTRSKTGTVQLAGITWSPALSLFCAVGTDAVTNNIFTSPDGITWTTQSKTGTSNIVDITWSPELGLFCAVGSTVLTNNIFTSPDGITWTTQSKTGTYQLFSVIWSPELGLFCAVALDSAADNIFTSPDGITWTTRSKTGTVALQGVTWSPELGLFCAAGSTAATNNIFTSPDGITWTTRSKTGTAQLTSITWSSELGLFCAVAFTAATDNIFTSPNGSTWTTRSKTGTYSADGVAWSPELGLFCVVSRTAAADNIFTSSGDKLFSTQSLDPDFLDEGRDVGSVQLLVKMRTGYVPSTLLASVSRDGGNVYQKIEMERIGASDSFVGTAAIWEELRNQTLFSDLTMTSTSILNITTSQAQAQKFTVASTTVVKSVDFYLTKTGTPDGVVFATIVREASSLPSTASADIMATSNSVLNNSVTGKTTFTFPDTVLVPGVYYVKFETDAAYKATFNAGVKEILYDSNSAGTGRYSNNMGTWGSDTGGLKYLLAGRVLDMRVMISSPVSATEMSAYGILYDLQTTGFTNSSKLIQRFDFNSTVDNLNEFTLTAFTPDPDLLTVYYIQGGQAFRYGAFSLDGHKIVFPVNSFNNGGVSQAMTVVAVQNEGSSHDNSDKNGLLLASNHLGSTDASIDKSIAGMGIFLRRPDGTLREIAIDNSDQIVIYSV